MGRNTQTILETMAKGYHECPPSPSVSVKSLLSKKVRSSSKGNYRLNYVFDTSYSHQYTSSSEVLVESQ